MLELTDTFRLTLDRGFVTYNTLSAILDNLKVADFCLKEMITII
jgi:hypothetical protein